MTEMLIPVAEPVLRRTYFAPLENVEWRAHANGTDYTLEGHAAVFNSWSETLSTWEGTFREQIAPGAFTKVLRSKPDVRLLINHDENFPLARTRSGTLKLTQDDTGLAVWAKVAPTTYANDLRMSMNRGDIDQMSFAFTVEQDSWTEDLETMEVTRTIERVGDLYDVSVVTFPAYPDTTAALREMRNAAERGVITLRGVVKREAEAPADEPVEDPEEEDTSEARSSRKPRERRMDMECLGLLVDMYKAGQDYMEEETDPSGLQAMTSILSQIELLVGADSGGAAARALALGAEKREVATPGEDPEDEDRDPVATPDEDPADDEDSPGGTPDDDPEDEGADVLDVLKGATRSASLEERTAYLRLLGDMTT